MEIRIDKDGNVTGDVNQISGEKKVMMALQGKNPKDGKGDTVTVTGDVTLADVELTEITNNIQRYSFISPFLRRFRAPTNGCNPWHLV